MSKLTRRARNFFGWGLPDYGPPLPGGIKGQTMLLMEKVKHLQNNQEHIWDMLIELEKAFAEYKPELDKLKNDNPRH